MFNLILPSFLGLLYLESKIKINLYSYIFYYTLISLTTNLFVVFILRLFKEHNLMYSKFNVLYTVLGVIISLLVARLIIFIKKNISISFERKDN